MFIISFDTVGGHYGFDTNFSSYDFTEIEVTGPIVDEISADSGSKEFTVQKGSWQPNTIFLATFNGTLEAGNLSMGDSEVDKLRFKKRKKGSLQWLLIDEVDYDASQITYTIYDRLARSNIEYEYCIVPVTGNTEGNIISNSIVALHEGLWIVDKDNSVNIFCEVDYGQINHHTNTNVFELLDNKYPIAITGELDYSSGSSSGRLIAKESWDKHKMDYDAELRLRENVIKFMKNGKPKIMKNNTGRYYLIVAKDVVEKPYDLDDASVTISFNWVEVGDAEDLATLIASDLMPEQLAGM